MDSRFQSLTLMDSPDTMDIDTSLNASRDVEGDVIMHDSIAESPSLPLRYHNYFHHIKKVNQKKNLVADLKNLTNAANDIPQSYESRSGSTLPDEPVAEPVAEPVRQMETPIKLTNFKDESCSPINTSASAPQNHRSSVLSPTMLGAKMAYKTSPLHNNSTCDTDATGNNNSNTDLSHPAPDALALASASAPPNTRFEVHHHHHHHFPSVFAQTSPKQDSTPMINEAPNELDQPQILTTQRMKESDFYLPKLSNFHEMPYYISTYLQVLVNLVIYAFVLHLAYDMVSGIKMDVQLRLQEKIDDALIDADNCRQQFEINKCFKDTVVPAIRDQCLEWEKGMHKDPFSSSAKAIIAAQMIGMILNELMQAIALRNWFVLTVIICSSFALNFVFGYVRAKIYFNSKDRSYLDAGQASQKRFLKFF